MSQSQQSITSTSIGQGPKSPSTAASNLSPNNESNIDGNGESSKRFHYEKLVPLSSLPAQWEAKQVETAITNADNDDNESSQRTEPQKLKHKDLKNIIIHGHINNHTLNLVNNMSTRPKTAMAEQTTPVSCASSEHNSYDSYHTEDDKEEEYHLMHKHKRKKVFHKGRMRRASSSAQSMQKMRMDLDIGFRSNAEMYRYNYRPIQYALFSILYLIIPSLIFVEGYKDQRSEKTAYLCYIYATYCALNGVLILYCFGIAVCVQHKKTSMQKEHMSALQQIDTKSTQITPTNTEIDTPVTITITPRNLHRQFSLDINQKCYCLTRFLYTFAEEFNKIFDIRNDISRIQAKIGPRFSGLVLVFSIFSCTTLFTLIAYKYGTALWSLCPDDTNQTDIANGQCLMRKIEIWNITTLSAMTIFVACSLISQVSEQCKNNKTLALGKILKAFEDRIVVKRLIGEIKASSDKLIYNLNMSSMKMIVLFNACLCFGAIVWHFYEFGYNQKYWIHCTRPKSKMFDVYGRCIVFFNSVIFLNELQRLMKQYRYILLVMIEFTNASCILHCQHIDDIIGWWQLRRYYRGYVIETFTNVFNTIIAWLLFIAFTFVLYLLLIIFYLRNYTLTPDEYVFCVMAFYLIYAVLTMLGIAVSCHKEQKFRHKMMLDRAIIAVKRKNILLATQREKLNEKTIFINKEEIDLMKDIRNDIDQHSLPIEILGLSMSPKTMYLIRGYFGASIGALLIESVLN